MLHDFKCSSFCHFVFYGTPNPLTENNNLALSEFKAFAEDIFNLTQMVALYVDWIENIVGKGENAGNQHFLLFSQCFQKPTSSRS